MDFLTVNFDPQDVTSQFSAPFRLLDLPIEILFKIMVFLDMPDLASLSKSCQYLNQLSNANYIYRSRFFYIKERLGIKLTIRPERISLIDRNILPRNININNTQQINLIQSLEKSFKKDTLKKNLKKRPSLNELKEKNIIKKELHSDLVNSKIQQFKSNELSEMLKVLCDSWKFHKKDIKHVKPNLLGADQKEVDFSIDEAKAVKGNDDEIEQGQNENVLIQDSKEEEQAEEMNEFMQVYMKFFHSSLMSGLGNKKSSPKKKSLQSKFPIASDETLKPRVPEPPRHVSGELNQLNIKHQRQSKFDDVPSFKEMQDRFEDESKLYISKVRSRKQYFEQLEETSRSSSIFSSASSRNSSRNVSSSLMEDSLDEVASSTIKDNIKSKSRTFSTGLSPVNQIDKLALRESPQRLY